MKEKGIIKNLFGQSRRRGVDIPDGLQLSVVGYLIERQKHGDALRADIEHEYSLKPSTADSLLAGMEQGGLINRVASEDGGEVIELTGRGYDLYAGALGQIWNLDLNPDEGAGGDLFSALAEELGEPTGSLS